MEEISKTTVRTDKEALGIAIQAIDEKIKEAHESERDDEVIYNDSVFANAVVEWLTANNAILIPGESGTDGCFVEHRFSGNPRRKSKLVSCWGSAFLRSPDKNQDGNEQYEIHLFLSEYHRSEDISEIAPAEFKDLHEQLFGFYKYSLTGALQGTMDHHHPAYLYAEKIRELAEKDQIASVRLWILTNSLYTGFEKASRGNLGGVNITAQLVDLAYIANLLTKGGTEADQPFDKIGGLECIRIAANGEQDYDCILTVIPGDTLASLYDLHGPALVRANVRAYLGEKVVVNKGIQETVRTEPCRFLAYNNGLVVSCRAAEFRDERLWKLFGIQIINGGQTTASIHRVWLSVNRNRRHPADGERLKDNLKKLRVPMKVIISSKDATESDCAAFRVRISAAANSQNAVRRSDLDANSPFQVKFAEMVSKLIPLDGNGQWFYENARGLYAASNAANRAFVKTHPEDRKFDKTQFALAYLACEGRARECAKGKEVAFRIFSSEIEALYENKSLDLEDSKKVQELVARWILFSSLEKRLSRILRNPRISTLYTLAMLHEEYGSQIQWGKIWQRQRLTEAFLSVLEQMGKRIDAIIRNNMGNFMIHMYGRQTECMEAVKSQFTFNGLSFEGVDELKSK